MSVNEQFRVTPDEKRLVQTVRMLNLVPKTLILRLVKEETDPLEQEIMGESEAGVCRKCGGETFIVRKWAGGDAMVCVNCHQRHKQLSAKIS